MSFLNPLLLFGLPLILLPIIIHLINRQRHRTLPWGAMMFLLDAKRLQKSMARLRYWLIMAMRMLAIAGLIFAVSRPLSSGWLGSAIGNKSDTVLLLLDRSPSMEQQDPISLQTKRETALNKLADLLKKTGEGKRVVLIESTNYKPEEIQADQLTVLPNTTTTATEADIPRLLQAAEEYLVSNEVGQADVWVASDLRSNDWRAEDGRWAALRDGFSGLDGVRFHLLTYSQSADENLSVSVANVRKRSLANANELVMDVIVRREGEDLSPKTLPLEFTVNGARTSLEIEIDGSEFAIQGHVIPIDSSVESGWGRVELPGDSNQSDNAFYFVFADESLRQVTVVSDDPQAATPLKIASSASPDPSVEFVSTVLPSSQVAEIDWDQTTLLIWNVKLPTGTVARQMQAYLQKKKPVLFLPPSDPNDDEFLGVKWIGWQKSDQTPLGIGSWDNDADLLARTQSGNALPVGKQKTARYCKLEGVGRTLARFTNGDVMLLRADGNLPAYFFSTVPRSDTSSLARDGVVMYVMLQRAIEMGAKQQGKARQLDAGQVDQSLAANWKLQTELAESIVSSDRSFHSGGYSSGEEEWTAINRPAAEDTASIIQDASLDEMFAGLDYQKINDDLGQGSPLANEVWRLFLILMAIALVVEAVLCLW